MKGFLPALLASAALALPAFAQNATTTPVGAMTIDFPATGALPATTSKYISVPLHADPVFTGKPTSVTSNTLEFSGVNWTTSPSQFGSTPPRFIVRILTGQQAGRVLQILTNTSNSITVSINDRTLQSTALDFSGFAVSTNDTIEITPCDTLASLFGDGSPENPLLISGGTNTFTADTISIQERASGKSIAYFFNTASGVNQWRRGTQSVSFNDLPIYPDDAILVLRRTNRPASQLVLTGRVPTVAPLIKAAPGGYYLTTIGLPVDISLQNLIFSGAWTNANSLFTADTVSIYNSAQNRFYAYFKRLDNGIWKASASATAPDVSSTVIPAASAVGILERATNKIGAESFNRMELPYSL